MQVLWHLDSAFIRKIIDHLPNPKPHYNTVSTTMSILEEKGFVSQEKVGNVRLYRPIISKDVYQQSAMGEMVENYFDNSYLNVVTYFAKNEKISADELESIINLIKSKS